MIESAASCQHAWIDAIWLSVKTWLDWAWYKLVVWTTSASLKSVKMLKSLIYTDLMQLDEANTEP